MIKAAIEKLISLADPQRMDIAERPYTSKLVYEVLDPTPETKTVHTLTGLADYLNVNPDKLTIAQLIIQVVSPREVKLFSALHGVFVQRSYYLASMHDQPEFQFGRFMDIEMFIIEMQAKFVQDETTAKILSIVGNITDGQINTFTDDGITQGVTVKTGIARVVNTDVPNPVTLAPFRTFTEVAQPEGRFVFRLKAGGAGDRPSVALFEADGGAWQIEAIKRLRDWLRMKVPEEVTIIA